MRRVIIMRGLPGSGKTTEAKKYGGTIVSADHYFTDATGKYRFIPSEIGDAHAQCFLRFKEAIVRGDETIVVDNTNTKYWEYKHYIKAAEKNGYEVKIHLVDSGLTPEELAKRGVHGVPVETIRKMENRFE